MLKMTSKLVGTVFFPLAGAVYIYFYFFTSATDCNPWFLPILQMGCLNSVFVWIIVTIVSTPGIALWAWGSSKKGVNQEYVGNS